MKKPLKIRLIEALKTNKKIWNRYISFCFKFNPHFSADLQKVDLRGVDLQGVNLRGVDFRWADLRGVDFRWADLRGVNLKGAAIQGTYLKGADLRGVNLDFSCLDLSCRSLNFKSDEKIRIQIAFHFASLIKNSDNATDEEQKIYSYILNYVNRFHRITVDKLPKI
jgi:hypothetical protein